MGNEEWEMEDEEWKMQNKNGESGMGNGEWVMENEEWRMGMGNLQKQESLKCGIFKSENF